MQRKSSIGVEICILPRSHVWNSAGFTISALSFMYTIWEIALQWREEIYKQIQHNQHPGELDLQLANKRPGGQIHIFSKPNPTPTLKTQQMPEGHSDNWKVKDWPDENKEKAQSFDYTWSSKGLLHSCEIPFDLLLFLSLHQQLSGNQTCQTFKSDKQVKAYSSCELPLGDQICTCCSCSYSIIPFVKPRYNCPGPVQFGLDNANTFAFILVSCLCLAPSCLY